MTETFLVTNLGVLWEISKFEVSKPYQIYSLLISIILFLWTSVMYVIFIKTWRLSLERFYDLDKSTFKVLFENLKDNSSSKFYFVQFLLKRT